jgi:hypothetical protein
MLFRGRKLPVKEEPKKRTTRRQLQPSISTPINLPIEQQDQQIISNGAILMDPSSNLPPAITTPQELRNVLTPMSPVGIDNINPESEDPESGKFLASLIAQGAAGFGAGIMGGSSQDILRSTGMFDRMRESDINRQDRLRQNELLRAERLGEKQEKQAEIKKREEQAKRFTDSKSEESKNRRQVYKSLGYDVSEDLSYADLENPVVIQSLRDKLQEKKLAAMPRGGIGVSGAGKVKDEKEKRNPYQKEINFINIYAKNGIQSLDKLKELIETKGTTELFGSSKTKMDQYIRDIAIAKTKILDPNSIVSQGEIDSVKETLGLGGYTSAFTSDKSAIEGVENFKKILQNNKNNAINILESLPSEESFNEKEKFIIEAYRDNPDDIDTKRAYENMMKSKGR